ncbi:MAG TPA: hypothetical protein PLP83_00615 [Candidatus Aminicenantes bacterium]|nr:hypothetical protein [Candidatus Aminicenantes bacterium]
MDGRQNIDGGRAGAAATPGPAGEVPAASRGECARAVPALPRVLRT